jgi:hypothetical protein
VGRLRTYCVSSFLDSCQVCVCGGRGGGGERRRPQNRHAAVSALTLPGAKCQMAEWWSVEWGSGRGRARGGGGGGGLTQANYPRRLLTPTPPPE